MVVTIRNSKALIGALFIQYIAYAVFYILDDFLIEKKPEYYLDVS
jgi:hypothetical protein